MSDDFERDPLKRQKEPTHEAKADLDSESTQSIDGPYATDLEKLIEAKEGGRKIVAVIGFGLSGKSFYINRLRYELPKTGLWNCMPKHKTDVKRSSSGIELTRAVTTRGKKHSYIITDVAGESFARGYHAVDKKLELQGKLDIDKACLTVIALADAYALFIPANDLHPDVTDDQVRKDLNKEMLDSFQTIVGLIKIANNRRVDTESIRDFLVDGITENELLEAFDKIESTTQRPICILYSQADRYAKNENVEGNYDQDPFLFTFRHFRNLAFNIHYFFEYYRFDFLSAFYGQPDDSDIPNYDLKSYGSVEAFTWLHKVLSSQHSLSGMASRLWNGILPTRKAIALRCLLDKRFKQEWRSS